MSAMNEKDEFIMCKGSSPLPDNTMEQVAGGEIHYPGDGEKPTPEEVTFYFNVGDRVEVWQSIFGNTKRGTITSRYVFCSFSCDRFYPVYAVNYDGGGSDSRVYQNQISY